MEQIILAKSQVRKIILNAMGLARKAQFGTGIEAVYKVISAMSLTILPGLCPSGVMAFDPAAWRPARKRRPGSVPAGPWRPAPLPRRLT